MCANDGGSTITRSKPAAWQAARVASSVGPAMLRMGTPAVRRDDARFPALQLANLIFGGYFSSRWTENIREDKGYTYSPRSGLVHAATASGFVLEVDVATALWVM